MHLVQGGLLGASQGGRVLELPKQALVQWGEELGAPGVRLEASAAGHQQQDISSTPQGDQQAGLHHSS